MDHSHIIGPAHCRQHRLNARFNQIVGKSEWPTAHIRIFIIFELWATYGKAVGAVPVLRSLPPVIADRYIEDAGPGETSGCLSAPLIPAGNNEPGFPAFKRVAVDQEVLRHL